MTILPIDEINALADRIKVYFEDDGKGRIKSRQDADAIIDEMFDLFMLSLCLRRERDQRGVRGRRYAVL